MYGSARKPRELLWIFGCVIFVLLMAEAFMGYVLPWGNMSFWGAQVITSLFGSLPVIGGALVEWIRGDYVIADATLNRFFAFHVAALPLALIFLVIAHVMALHEVGSNNPDGIEIKKLKGPDGHPLDGIPFHPYYTVKDIVGVAGFLLIFCGVIFFAPNGRRLLPGSPELYARKLRCRRRRTSRRSGTSRRYYAMLRAVPSFAGTQVWGVLVMGIRHCRAVLRAVAGPLAGQIHPLPRPDLQDRVGGLRRFLRDARNLRHETAVRDLSAVVEDRNGPVFRVLFADAVVHENRSRAAGAGEGHGTCLSA